MATYEVIVGNIGIVHKGSNLLTARKEYLIYVSLSDSGYNGRASGENVTLMKDGEILKEHIGAQAVVDGFLDE